MKLFIPPNHIDLAKGVEIAAKQWFPEQMAEATLSPEESRKIVAFHDARLAVGRYEESVGQAVRPPEPTVEQLSLITLDKEIEIKLLNSRLSRRPKVLKFAWDQLIGHLFTEQLVVRIISERGTISDVPGFYWGSIEGQRSYNSSPMVASRPWRLVFHDGWGHSQSGTPFINPDHLKNVLAGQPASPTVAPTSEIEPVAPPPYRKAVGEAPRKYDSEALLVEASRLLYVDGLVPATQAELRKAALEAYCATIDADGRDSAELPSDEWAKPIIRKLWNRLKLGERN
jgi:hypothetical protein